MVPPSKAFQAAIVIAAVSGYWTVSVRVVEAAILEFEVSVPSSVSVYVPLATSSGFDPLPPQPRDRPRIPTSSKRLVRRLALRLRILSSRKPANAAAKLAGTVRRGIGALPEERKDVVPILTKECRVLCRMDDELQSLFEV
jgi:hypothetical protein